MACLELPAHTSNRFMISRGPGCRLPTTSVTHDPCRPKVLSDAPEILRSSRCHLPESSPPDVNALLTSSERTDSPAPRSRHPAFHVPGAKALLGDRTSQRPEPHMRSASECQEALWRTETSKVRTSRARGRSGLSRGVGTGRGGRRAGWAKRRPRARTRLWGLWSPAPEPRRCFWVWAAAPARSLTERIPIPPGLVVTPARRSCSTRRPLNRLHRRRNLTEGLRS